MLILNRNLTPYEVMTCKLTGNLIVYGDYYYEDTEDNTVVLAREYDKLKKKSIASLPQYQELLLKAQNEQEYRQALDQAQRDYLNQTILNKEIARNGTISSNGIKEWEDK